MANQIQQLVIGRIRALMEIVESAGVLSHPSSIGAIREKYAREFLLNFLPGNLAITSGFICDPLGKLTPQLDVIIYDPSRLPPIAMPAEITIVPSDSALAVVEIKSSLTVSALGQIMQQSVAIEALAHAGTSVGTDSRVIVPQVVLAYESAVAVDTMDTWFQECHNLVLLCVLNSVTLSKTTAESRIRTYGGTEKNYKNVRVFGAQFFDLLHHVVQLRRSITPAIAHYLVPEWKEGLG
jgi:hypothetical protein